MRRSFLMAAALFLAAGSANAVSWREAQIVIPETATPPVEYAAKALQTELHRFSGFAPEIVREHEAPDAAGWHVGPTAKSQAAIPPEELAPLAQDGVRLRSRDGEVFLRGGDPRAEIYSVYVLMERLYGVRYLTADCTNYPSVTATELPEVDYAFAPTFAGREILYAGAYGRDISLKQRLNGRSNDLDASVGGKVSLPEVHSMFRWLPPEEFFAAHPEYYSLRDGKRIRDSWQGAQLCLTNPEVLRIVTERVLAYLREHPEVGIVDVSQMDSGTGGNGCECDVCRAVNAEEGSPAGAVIRFVNAIAREVAREFPGKTVSTLAYQHTRQAPKRVKPEPNVLVRLCHTGCFIHGLACPASEQEQYTTPQDLVAWSRLTSNIAIWHYAVDFQHYFAPNPYLLPLARDLQTYAASQVREVMVQGDWQSPGGELAELRQYLIARMLWDADQSPEAVIREFCASYYGAAAPAVLEYLQWLNGLCDDPNLHRFGYWDPSLMITPDFYLRAVALLNRALQAAQTPEERDRVELLFLPYRYLQLTWPDRYPATLDRELLIGKVRALAQRHGITHYAEGGNDRTLDAWLERISPAR